MSNMIFTPSNDFRGTGSTYDSTYPNFGLTVYKNYESNGYDDETRNPLLSAHIAPCVEMGCGAHYYSRSLYSSTYRKAETVINLNNITVDLKGRRVACISLGVVGYYGSCDMGIETKDNGASWFGHYWCANDGAWGTDGKRVGSGMDGEKVYDAASVKITIIPSQTNTYDGLKGIFEWYSGANASGTRIKYYEIDCHTVERGRIYAADSSGLTLQRYQRFMSLIPADNLGYSPQSDTADGSKLIGGNLNNNKLYTANGSSVAWGTNLMDYIWSVQGWNISSFNPGNNDTFSCTHSNYMYNTNV